MARIIGIEKLTLREMIRNFHLYFGLPDGLAELPCPGVITIGRKEYHVPQTMDEFANSICYGQRLYMARQEENDIQLIMRMMRGYYYPLITFQKWDEQKSLLIQNNILTCTAKDLYPVTMHFVKLISEIADRERKLLHRTPTKMELAAGIEKLNVFAELNSLDFLRDAMKCDVPEVLHTPYNECLVRFLNAKEITDYQERYYKLQKEEYEAKSKYKK